MADYQAIAQGLRAALRPEARVSHDELADLAAGFATISREANKRLERCLDYASNGLNSEAAHLASCQPSLERLISAFQSIDLRQWGELCANHGVLPGPPLLLEAWPKVKSVLDSERLLRPLLARYRTLAIAKSPVAERLQIARSLARHDSATAVWADQIRMLEGLRLSELATHLKVCAGTPESAAFKDLVREVTAENWLLPLPDELASALRPILDAEKARVTLKDLTLLATWLESEAANHASAEKLDEMINRWHTLVNEFSATGRVYDRISSLDARIAHLRQRLSDQRIEEQKRLMTSMFYPTTPAAAAEKPVMFSRGRLALAIVVIGLIGTVAVVAVKKPPLFEQWLGKSLDEKR